MIRSQINLGFHIFYMEIAWKIHGISYHQRGGNPDCIVDGYQKSYKLVIITGFTWTINVASNHSVDVDNLDITKM